MTSAPEKSKRHVRVEEARRVPRHIREFSQRIVKEFRPEKIVLFGSYAYGTPRPDSDVDLLVIMKFKGRGLTKSLEILNRLDPPFAIDLIARTPEDVEERYKGLDPLIREAVDKGVVLYEHAA